MSELNRPLDYFTDPYQLPEKQLFTWRMSADRPTDQQASCEAKDRELIRTCMRYHDLQGRAPDSILPQISLDRDATYDEVSALMLGSPR